MKYPGRAADNFLFQVKSMKKNRRDFLKTTAVAGGATAILPFTSSGIESKTTFPFPDYSKLDKVLKLPVLKRELFSSPVIIEKCESIDGVIKVPSGSGLGLTISPDYIKTHKVVL